MKLFLFHLCLLFLIWFFLIFGFSLAYYFDPDRWIYSYGSIVISLSVVVVFLLLFITVLRVFIDKFDDCF